MIDDGAMVGKEEMLPIASIARSNIEHSDEVLELSARAQSYLRSMSWCKEILDGWLYHSCGYIIGVFYFEILPSKPEVPQFVWIITGDLPPAYMDGEFHRSGYEALKAYVDEMQEWVDRVLDGRPLDDDVITVNVPPERAWAERLQTRLNMIRQYILGSPK